MAAGVARHAGRRRADRRVAGLLDRLRRHPGVHRDAGRHAALPRPDPDRAGQPGHRPVPRPVRTLANGFLDGYLGNVGLGPLGGADCSRCSSASSRWPAIARQQWRTRRGPASATAGGRAVPAVRRQDRRGRRASSCCFVVVQLARFKNLPCVLVLLAVAGHRLHADHQPHRVRPAHLRHRRQPAGGGRCPASRSSRSLLDLRQHGRARRRSPAIIFAGRLNQAGPTAGNSFELDAIAAAFIGGAAVQGGVGTVVGAIIGGLIMAVMNNGMSLMGVAQRAGHAGQGPRAARGGRLRRLDQAPRRRAVTQH